MESKIQNIIWFTITLKNNSKMEYKLILKRKGNKNSNEKIMIKWFIKLVIEIEVMRSIKMKYQKCNSWF